VEQLSEWKNQFNDRLNHVQEELLTFLLQRHLSDDELGYLIRNTFADFKLSISELLNTMATLLKKFIKKSKKLVQNSDQYWQTIVIDLNNQLEHMTRMRDVEQEKNRESERELKRLRTKIQNMKLESVHRKDEYDRLNQKRVHSPPTKKEPPAFYEHIQPTHKFADSLRTREEKKEPTPKAKRAASPKKETPSPRPKPVKKIEPKPKKKPHEDKKPEPEPEPVKAPELIVEPTPEPVKTPPALEPVLPPPIETKPTEPEPEKSEGRLSARERLAARRGKTEEEKPADTTPSTPVEPSSAPAQESAIERRRRLRKEENGGTSPVESPRESPRETPVEELKSADDNAMSPRDRLRARLSARRGDSDAESSTPATPVETPTTPTSGGEETSGNDRRNRIKERLAARRKE
jgi:hypothetical protein